ncbi:hypothetical protein [Nonomuraea sp. JJY05]|uniref:hypothetical protein n=1 Tax=Nonomuraea sp. JJY05 TaxID=3350255 RepID=UPI00373F01F3
MLSDLEREIREVAASDEPLPDLPYTAFREFGRTGERLGYERRYFGRRARLAALGLLDPALLDPPGDALDDVVWATCDEYTWVLPAHRSMPVDLFACETAHTLAELADQVDPVVGERARAEVMERVLDRFLDPRPMEWEGFGNNWEAVCGGAAGMAALAVLDDPEPVLARCRAAMRRFLDGYGDDGGCVEGVAYWVYGFGYFVYFAEALRERTGEDLLDHPKVAAMAAFPHRVRFADGGHVPFSDTTDNPFLPAGLLTRLAERFGTPGPDGVPSFHADHCYRWGHLSRTLSWYRPVRSRPVETTSYLPDLAWVVDRGEHGYGFAAKGGHNDEPHNHDDLGHFVLRAAGRNVLDDLGAGEYTRDYFGDRRHTFLHPSAEGHSLPVVDGVPQRGGRAEVLEYAETPDGLTFALDLSSAYPAPVVRRFRWHRDGRLDLRDEFGGDVPVEEVFISRIRPEPQGDRVSWDGLVTLDHPGFEATVETLDTRDHHGRPDTVHRLRLRVPPGHPAVDLRFTCH